MADAPLCGGNSREAGAYSGDAPRAFNEECRPSDREPFREMRGFDTRDAAGHCGKERGGIQAGGI